MDRTTTIIAALCVSFGLTACDKAAAPKDKGSHSADKTPKKAAEPTEEPAKAAAAAKPAAKPSAKPAAKPAAKAEPAAPAEIVLEEADLAGLGKIKLPKGYKPMAEKHWTYDLGGGKNIHVSWEPHGAKNLKKAEKLSNVLANAPTIKSSKTLDTGYHEIERVRDSDGYTFIAVFSADWYVKCTAPAEQMDKCREIVRSKA